MNTTNAEPLNFDLENNQNLENTVPNLQSLPLQKINDKAILKEMIKKQSCNRWYNENIIFKKERIKILFGVIQKTSEILELNINTFCQAVHIFDALAAKFPLEKDEMLPISLVSMQLASKVSENQGKIVNYKDLNDFVYNYGVDFYIKIEQTIMEQLDFKINLISPNVVLNFLIQKFIYKNPEFFGELQAQNGIEKEYFKILMNVHLITLVDYEFYEFSSLAVATSILVFSRILVGLEAFPDYMSNFIGITEHSIKQCLQLIYENYSINFVQRVFEQIDEEINQNENMEQQNLDNRQNNSLIQNSTLYFLCDKFQEEIMTKNISTEIIE